MLPTPAFEDEEAPSGTRRRGPPAANYRDELCAWFGAAPAPPPLPKAVGAPEWRAEPASGRIPFLIF